MPADLTNVVDLAGGLAGGTNQSLALRLDGTVVGWGAIGPGGNGVPTGLSNVAAVAVGGGHSLALTADGRVIAWGNDAEGQAHVPDGLAGIVAIAAGRAHSLALDEQGNVHAWGADSDGQATPPGELNNVVAIAAGEEHSLALRRDGTVRAWGANHAGQLNIPTGLSNVVAIAAGGGYSLAVIGLPVAAPRAVSPQNTSGIWEFAVPTVRGARYALEFRETLDDSPWRAASLPPMPGNGSWVVLRDAQESGPQRFYRVRVR
jgi:hypothetical protein